jgi:uncharacterized membrane protein (DUF485 family)
MDERGEHWSKVAQTSAFQDLMRRKKKFIIPATIFFFVYYMGLPVLAGFTTVLNVQVIGALSLAWIYALSQFVMTWTLLHLYIRQANKWDDLVDQIRNETASQASQTSRTSESSETQETREEG